MESVTEWLKSLKLNDYASIMKNLGYDDLEEIQLLNGEEIELMIGEVQFKGMHAKRIRKALHQKPRQTVPSSLEYNNVPSMNAVKIEDMSTEQVRYWFSSNTMKDLSKLIEKEGIDGEVLSLLVYNDFVEMGAIKKSYKKKIFDFKLSALKESGYIPVIFKNIKFDKCVSSDVEKKSYKKINYKKRCHSNSNSNISELKISNSYETGIRIDSGKKKNQNTKLKDKETQEKNISMHEYFSSIGLSSDTLSKALEICKKNEIISSTILLNMSSSYLQKAGFSTVMIELIQPHLNSPMTIPEMASYIDILTEYSPKLIMEQKVLDVEMKKSQKKYEIAEEEKLLLEEKFNKIQRLQEKINAFMQKSQHSQLSNSKILKDIVAECKVLPLTSICYFNPEKCSSSLSLSNNNSIITRSIGGDDWKAIVFGTPTTKYKVKILSNECITMIGFGDDSITIDGNEQHPYEKKGFFLYASTFVNGNIYGEGKVTPIPNFANIRTKQGNEITCIWDMLKGEISFAINDGTSVVTHRTKKKQLWPVMMLYRKNEKHQIIKLK